MQGDEKVRDFLTAITKEAEELRSQLEKETDEYVMREMAKAEKKLKIDVDNMMKKRTEAILGDIGRELSRKQQAARGELFARRGEIVEELFRDAAARIDEYIKSDKYPILLCRLATEAAKAAGGGNVTLFVSDRDMVYEAELKKAVPGCTVASDKGILLGGVRVLGENGTLSADNTLDSRLAEQKKLFRERTDTNLSI